MYATLLVAAERHLPVLIQRRVRAKRLGVAAAQQRPLKHSPGHVGARKRGAGQERVRERRAAHVGAAKVDLN